MIARDLIELVDTGSGSLQILPISCGMAVCLRLFLRAPGHPAQNRRHYRLDAAVRVNRLDLDTGDQ